MTNKSDELNEVLVDTLIRTIKELDTETPATILNVARSYVRDHPPEDLPVPGSGSGVLKEFLETIPFKNPNA